MLVRTQNCIINTDNITFATYSRTITTLGTGGALATPMLLEIHFTGTENKTFKGGEAETVWAHLVKDIQPIEQSPPTPE